MKINDLTASQIVVLLASDTIIGFNPSQLRKRLKQLNKEAFEKDRIRRNELLQEKEKNS